MLLHRPVPRHSPGIEYRMDRIPATSHVFTLCRFGIRQYNPYGKLYTIQVPQEPPHHSYCRGLTPQVVTVTQTGISTIT